MERFVLGFLSAAIVVSIPMATGITVLMGAGHFFGFCQPNVIPEAGETYLGFYTMLWSCVAFPAPLLVGTLSALQGVMRKAD